VISELEGQALAEAFRGGENKAVVVLITLGNRSEDIAVAGVGAAVGEAAGGREIAGEGVR